MSSFLFKEELKKEKESFVPVEFKNQRRNLKVLKQTGKSIKSIDSKREALASGKRVSKTGKVYWETRKNRSDSIGKNI